MTDADTIRPFYCGTQYVDWESANCCRCARFGGMTEDYEWDRCEMADKLTEACIGDGRVDMALAVRYGWHRSPGCWAPPRVCAGREDP